jgi:hypothetical protein
MEISVLPQFKSAQAEDSGVTGNVYVQTEPHGTDSVALLVHLVKI